MFCLASRPLAYPACLASPPFYAPAVTPSEVSDSARVPRPVSAEIAPHPDAVAGGGVFSAGERRRMQAEADNHPLATSTAAIEPAALAPALTLGSPVHSTSPSQSRLPIPRWPCEADEGWKELLGFDLTVLAPPRGHPVRTALPKAREDKDYPAFAMALREMGVPADQIARAAVDAGLLPTQQRSVIGPEAGSKKISDFKDGLRDELNLFFKQAAETVRGLPPVRAKLEAFLAAHKTRMPQEERAQMEALSARLGGAARFG